MTPCTRAASSVRIGSSSVPSVTVIRHRSPMSNYFLTREKGKGENTNTNEVLRKGGSLPTIGPEVKAEGEKDHDVCLEQSARKQKFDFMIRDQKTSTNGKEFNRSKPNVSSHSRLKDVRIEQKIELLTDELSEVKQILSKQFREVDSKDIIKCAVDIDPHLDPKMFISKRESLENLRSISAREYLIILTEMNEGVNVAPYDPSEFTEEEKVSLRRQNMCDSLKIQSSVFNLSCDADKTETLQAVQSELALWREEQQEANKERTAL